MSADARKLAEDALEWAADFRAGDFHVHCTKCGAGEPYLPPELFGLAAENETLARELLAALDREAALVAGSSKGRTADFESANPGSSPGPAVGILEKAQAQQARLRNLEQKYATVKGSLQVAEARADALEAALEGIVLGKTPKPHEEVALEALAAHGQKAAP